MSSAQYSDSDEDCDLIQPSINIALYINPRKRRLDESESSITTKNIKPPLKKQRSDLDMNKISMHQCVDSNQTGLKHWNVFPGLNYYGVPIHSVDCQAFGQQVSVNRGFGNANVIKDINMRKCPSCKVQFELSGVVMFQCTAIVKYQIGNNPIITKKYTVRGNDYIDFGQQQKLDQKEILPKKQQALANITNKNNNNDDNKVDVDDNRISKYKMLQFQVQPIPKVQQFAIPINQNKNKNNNTQLPLNTVWNNIIYQQNINNKNNNDSYNEQREKAKLQMSRNIVNAYQGRVTLEQVTSMPYDRIKGLHDEIVKRLNATKTNTIVQ